MGLAWELEFGCSSSRLYFRRSGVALAQGLWKGVLSWGRGGANIPVIYEGFDMEILC